MIWPSPDAVIVPAQGATSVILRRRPGRTSFFQRCSRSFLSASASSVMRSTTTVVPSFAWARGNGSTRGGLAIPGIGLPCGRVLESMRLLVGVGPVEAERVREPALQQAVPARHDLGDLPPLGGKGELFAAADLH